jgi:hypothetical protein
MPDVGMAVYQMSRQRKVIFACEKWWHRMGPNHLANKSDCSGFVSSVASELGVPGGLTGSANDMYHKIQSSPWSVLGAGDHGAHLAAVAATNGKFVVGAWRNPSGGHGHVAVIVDTNYSSATVPHRTRALAYWGTLGSEGEKRSIHSNAWGASKRPHVIYSAMDISQ